MLFKPWNDGPAPRHTFEDEFEGDETKPSPVPEIKIELKEHGSIDYLILAPKNISVIIDSLPQRKAIGSIRVSYPELKVQTTTQESTEDDYDEDEQLYNAIHESNSSSKYSDLEIPINVYSGSIAGIVVPHFTNAITYNILSRRIIEAFDSMVKKDWITLSPCSINNNQSLNKLSISTSNSLLEMIPNLKPPHFITGIGASIISELNNLGGTSSFIPLVLNSEGQPGFEKVSNDAIVDSGYVLSEILIKDHYKDDYLKKISSSVRKFNSYSNSGMYL
ncbi:hypothetical protein HYPBUDRAFT_118481 [Hyphopichia burtonii NRRL Y-1933]|uniref:Proteasome assembly chaperone 1 n=1 Tax=Hyphopichia burtonii NRRL Y-1933 TaxID=984485 RepID=A0A1E4RSK0_9ASCO|nr:hypothetical protein HYPBUDRAFT_118481 [Hyphopichia burtonii NRRL Y-1933]ODV70262.1 hypothetical protein HYPBUDRAFT_118481 [Hyphopichia burtonii NRRL Y-1933]